MTTSEQLAVAFEKLYGEKPGIYRAPGRVNLIGEHTDYNDGFVMPAAIDFSTYVAIAPRDDRCVVIRSSQFSETVELDLDNSPSQGRGHWSDYPFGVAVKLEAAGHRLRGANILVRGEVPIGSGLSSSAAIEVSTGFALLDISQVQIDRMELAKTCRQAENEFVGIRSGLMDQFIACFGKTGQALMLDCRSLEATPLPLPEGVRLVVCNTMVKHHLAANEYNARRAECEEGVRVLSRRLPQIRSLRDLSRNGLERFRSELSEVVFRRCRHVLTENERVKAAAEALRTGHFTPLEELMRASHESLRDDYEVSCKELDLMVELAGRIDGVLGARMTGGGFGGCTINLVARDSVAEFNREVGRGYAEQMGREPEIYVCSAAQGAERVQ